MRPGYQGGLGQFGTSPSQQMQQFSHQQRNNHQNGNYNNNNNKNFQHPPPHPNAPPNNQVPNGPQARVSEAAVEETK